MSELASVMCEVDWKLLLEFVRASMPLLAGVAVALLAVRGFREQKAIERRCDWCEKVHRQLTRTSTLFLRAAVGPPEEQVTRRDEALNAGMELAGLADEGWMYAAQPGFEAVQRLFEGMAQAHVEVYRTGRVSAELAERVSTLCLMTSSEIALELRRELRLRMPKARTGVTRTVRIPDASGPEERR